MKRLLSALAGLTACFNVSAQALLPEQTLSFNMSDDVRKLAYDSRPVQSAASSSQSGTTFSPNLQRLFYTLSLVNMYYVENVDESKVVDDAIRGMLEKLDPHSTYIPAKEVEKSMETLNGNFSGIGVQFQMLKDTLFVIQTISGGPSERATVVRRALRP